MHLATQGNNISTYKVCVRDAKSLKYPSEPILFNNANNIDLGAIPKYLPTLTKVEEIIITCIHIHLQVARVLDSSINILDILSILAKYTKDIEVAATTTYRA